MASSILQTQKVCDGPAQKSIAIVNNLRPPYMRGRVVVLAKTSLRLCLIVVRFVAMPESLILDDHIMQGTNRARRRL